ncbi:NAD-dependent epimerase/dehydratase family protein [Achromobacter xylosoxidans]
MLGATSLVGRAAISLLLGAERRVIAFSRRPQADSVEGVHWELTHAKPGEHDAPIEHWLCVAPIWVLPEYFPLLERRGVRRIVALSSTSRYTKLDSGDPLEREVVRRLSEAEVALQAWAESNGVEWVVLRPTLIYGYGQDRNVTEIIRVIKKLGFFPLLGKATGLRQPIHAEDVAQASVAALKAPAAANQAYNLSGGETLSYREMVSRIFLALGRSPRFVGVPLFAITIIVTCCRVLPRFRKWSPSMAQRMNLDMVFDHAPASRDLEFSPRQFHLSTDDIPA